MALIIDQSKIIYNESFLVDTKKYEDLLFISITLRTYRHQSLPGLRLKLRLRHDIEIKSTLRLQLVQEGV